MPAPTPSSSRCLSAGKIRVTRNSKGVRSWGGASSSVPLTNVLTRTPTHSPSLLDGIIRQPPRVPDRFNCTAASFPIEIDSHQIMFRRLVLSRKIHSYPIRLGHLPIKTSSNLTLIRPHGDMCQSCQDRLRKRDQGAPEAAASRAVSVHRCFALRRSTPLEIDSPRAGGSSPGQTRRWCATKPGLPRRRLSSTCSRRR